MIHRERRRCNYYRCEPPCYIQLLVVLTTSFMVMACCASGALLVFGLDNSLLLIYRSTAGYVLASVLFLVAVLATMNCSVAYCGLHFESKSLLLFVLIIGLFTMTLQLATSLTTIALADKNYLIAGINSSLVENCNNSKMNDLQNELQCCAFSCPTPNCTSVEKLNDCVSVLSNNLKKVLYTSFGVDVLVIVLGIITTCMMCNGIRQIRKYELYDII